MCSAKFNLMVQGTVDNNISDSTTLTMTSQVKDPSTSTISSVKTTTADSVTDMPPLTNGTDGSDLIITAGPTLTTTAKTNKINDRGFQVGSLQFYMVVAAGSGIAVTVLTAIVILVIYLMFHVLRSKSSKFISRLPRQGQRSRNRDLLEDPLADVSIVSVPDVGYVHTPEENPPLEFPVYSPPGTNAEGQDHEVHRERDLPPRKCDRIPIYIFLGPKESDPPFPKSPIKCKNNLAYLHLGPEDSSTAAPLQHKPITCKQNAAYIHLDPDP